MSKLRLWLPALLGLTLLVACGEEPRIPIGDPKEELTDAPKYFGVEPCQCYEYKSLDPAEPRLLGIAVERVDDFYSDERGADRYELVYRLGGTWQMRYVLDPSQKPDLLLSRVYTGQGVTDDEWRMSPAVPLLRYPVKADGLIEKSTVATLHHNGLPVEGETRSVEYDASYAGLEEVRASLDGENFQTFEAMRVEYFETPWNEQYRWFVPEVGNVKLRVKLKSMDRASDWVLHNIRTLDSSCPGEAVHDFCGGPR